MAYSIKKNPNTVSTVADADKYGIYDDSAGLESSVTAANLAEGVKTYLGTNGVQTIVSTDDVTAAAPTDAELDAAFGQPATLGEGFVGIVNDNDAGLASILCWVSDAKWFHVVGTLST